MKDSRRLLVKCRGELYEIKRLQEDVQLMARGCERVEANAPLVERKRMAERELAHKRHELPALIGEAMSRLDALPRTERKVLYLYYVLGYSYNAVAREMGIALRSVYRLRTKAFEILDADASS